MSLRSRKLTALLLTLSLILTSNIAAFAAGIGAESEEMVYVNATTGDQLNSPTDSTTDTQPTTAAQMALSGNVTIIAGSPSVRVSDNNTIRVDEVKEAIINDFIIKVGNKEYLIEDNSLYERRTGLKPKWVADHMDRCFTISLNKIRKAGTVKQDSELTYADDKKQIISDAKGNQIVTYTAGIDPKVVGAKNSKTIGGEALLRTCYSGLVSTVNVGFGENGKYRLVVDYDAAVEFRGTRVTATSHFLTTETEEVTGVVDGAVGVSAKLQTMSSNGVWYDMEKDNSVYFWKDDSGITLKKPKIYNAKKVNAYYESDGPYFKIKMTYSKKAIENDPLTSSDKQLLKDALNSTRFPFTVEPRKINTELITYSKYEPDKYYIKKLTYNEEKNTLKGNIQFMGQKRNKGTLNARKLRKLGKKLNVLSKEAYGSGSSSKAKKADVFFEYNDNTETVTLTAVNGYYGTAIVTKKIVKK